MRHYQYNNQNHQIIGVLKYGENLYAKHSIHYKELINFFLIFSIWNEKNNCLSWNDTIEWADLLGLKIVPVLYRGIWNYQEILKRFEKTAPEVTEGFVVRAADSFNYGQFKYNIAKYVRKNHVRTHAHWMQQQIILNEMK